MADQPGFQIDGHFFPFVQQYKHGDPILIHEVTGLEWDEFAEAMQREAEKFEEAERMGGAGFAANPIVQTALLAVAVQRAQPKWSRRRVADYIRNIDLGSEEVVGPDSDTPKPGDLDGMTEAVIAQAIPPPEAAENSSISADKSSTPEESPPESSASPSRNSSADPGSSITTPEFAHPV